MNSLPDNDVVCEESNCYEVATTFDGQNLMFRCSDHPTTEAGGSDENS